MRQIVYYNDPNLRKPAADVTNITAATHKLVMDMLQIIHKKGGIGLAAPQVGINKKIVIVGQIGSIKPSAFINPEIVSHSDANLPYEEGCLSLPGLKLMLYRPSEITLRAYDMHGNQINLTGDGLWARVIQHEVDHLNGVLITDYITSPHDRPQIEAYLATDPTKFSQVKQVAIL